ncbi:uncharacterized protein isoform X1 [Musca autumnalis]|uniref:uncharacterized protein isoform X1 n=1 Tax=Musca autumnalis TaxID=221902 RepID=UPI003CF76E73
MFQKRVTFLILLVLIVSLLTDKADAGYTSEETDEKSKSIHSAVTSILDTTDISKHHRKHTYDAPPCSSGGGCAVNGPGFILPASTPCSSPSGCPPLTKTTTYGNGIVYPSPSPNVVHGSIGVPQPPPSAAGYQHYTGHGTPIASLPPPPPPGVPAYGGYVYGHYPPQPTGQGAVPPRPQAGYGYGYGVPTGPAPPSPQAGYGYGYAGPTGPAAPPPQPAGYGYGYAGRTGPAAPHAANGAYGYHPYPAGQAGHYDHEGGRGHSIHNHSLKTKSEYTEVGTHTGPLQQANGGYGYGSGYGGYNGMFNRPGF